MTEQEYEEARRLEAEINSLIRQIEDETHRQEMLLAELE